MKNIRNLLILNLVLTVSLFGALFHYTTMLYYEMWNDVLNTKSKATMNNKDIEYNQELIRILLLGVNNEGFNKWKSLPVKERFELVDRWVDLSELRDY